MFTEAERLLDSLPDEVYIKRRGLNHSRHLWNLWDLLPAHSILWVARTLVSNERSLTVISQQPLRRKHQSQSCKAVGTTGCRVIYRCYCVLFQYLWLFITSSTVGDCATVRGVPGLWVFGVLPQPATVFSVMWEATVLLNLYRCAACSFGRWTATKSCAMEPLHLRRLDALPVPWQSIGVVMILSPPTSVYSDSTSFPPNGSSFPSRVFTIGNF